MNNQILKQYTINQDGEEKYLCETTGGTFRFNRMKNTWIETCKYNGIKKCISYVKHNGYCDFHQNSFKTTGDTPRYFSLKIKSKTEKLAEFNGKIYRFNERSKKWMEKCNYVDEECYNYCTLGCFCDRHQGGIDNGGNKESTSIGDEKEVFIYNLMMARKEFTEVKINGREGSELDILYKLKSEIDNGINQYRGIQVKTMSNYIYGYILNIDGYNNNTVIIGVNNEMTHLCIFFKGTLRQSKTVTINFNDPQPEYRCNIFFGLNDNSLGYSFIDMLVEYSKSSTLYSESKISSEALKERESLLKIENFCKNNGVRFEYADTANSSIDCKINYKNIQCKYSSVSQYNTYFKFGITKVKIIYMCLMKYQMG